MKKYNYLLENKNKKSDINNILNDNHDANVHLNERQLPPTTRINNNELLIK